MSNITRLLTWALFFTFVTAIHAQSQSARPAQSDYVVGPHDVVMITSYDQSDLTGKFTVETDGTFSYPLIGRIRAGGLTLRELEASLKKRLKDGGFFVNPQLTVVVEEYKSQRYFVVGEVRSPGAYPLSGDMSLVEAIARAGSILPTASGDAIIVHSTAPLSANGPALPTPDAAANAQHVDLRAMQNGIISETVRLEDGDMIFVPRAESVYVFGFVKNPGAYALQQRQTSVLQALSLAGGVTDRGATTRIRLIRTVKNEKTELRVKLTDIVQPGDTVIVAERIF
jgi:polysaccharide export outer membrane protein